MYADLKSFASHLNCGSMLYTKKPLYDIYPPLVSGSSVCTTLDEWTKKCLYKHSEMLFSPKRERNSVICYHFDDVGEDYA